MRVTIKSRKSAPNIIDVYALAANGDSHILGRFMVPTDGDFVADTEAAKAFILALNKRWKDIF